jgi:Ca2+-binding RTX toxin-like protein
MAIATELNINTAATAMDMANAIFGPGITVSTASYSGDAASSGIYSGALTSMPGVSLTDTGVILSTGSTTVFTNPSSFVGDTNTNTSTGAGSDVLGGINGDAQLNAVAGMGTFDGAILTATFTPDGDYLTMQFVFTSEEYPEYVSGGVNDAFGVWVNGTFVPVSITVAGNVAIDEVNGGKNENLYRDNTADQFNTEMDGLTYTLSLKAAVLKGQPNTIKIGIADGGDAIYDSNLLIMADSVQTVTLAMDDTVNVVANSTRNFDILANDTQTGGANLIITQINGTNVIAGQTVTLTSGQQVRLNADGTVTVFANGVLGLENLSYTVTDGTQTDIGYIHINTTSGVTTDGIVSGTSGADVIDTAYLGDPDGDKVDNNDATGVQGTTGNADVIYAGAGNDSVTAGAGNDIIDADSGDDTVFGGAGDDRVTLGSGNDSFGTFNADSAGNDTVFGDGGNDYIITGSDNDIVFAGTGNDSLSGGIGADTLYGGDGEDWIMVTDDHDTDTLVGGEGGSDLDIIGFGNFTTTDGVNVTFTGNESGTYTFRAAAPADVASSGIFSEIEGISGTDFSDNINAGSTATNQYIHTNGGADTVAGGSGNDEIDGGSGNDLLTGGAGNDLIFGGADADTIHGGGGDTVVGGEATTPGGTDNDTLYATNVVGLTYGGGNNEAGTVTFTDGSTLNFSQIETLVLNGGNPDGIIFGTAGNDSIGAGYVDGNGDVIDNNDAILSNPGSNDDEVYAGTGDDTVNGLSGNDYLYGGDGNDSLEGGIGNDYMQGDAGDDTVVAGEGNDFIRGDAGNDLVYGGLGDDSTYGGLGEDQVFAGDGNDEAYGGYGNDVVYGGAGDDNVTGSGQDDVVYGDDGNDTVHGADGNDTLYGGAGADTLLGEDDADLIYGGAGDYADGFENVTVGTDNDTLNVSDVASVTFDAYNPENGVVTFNGGGSLNFYNIEHVIVDGTEIFAPDFIVEGTGGDDLINAAYVGDPEGDRIDAGDNLLGNNDDHVLAGTGNDTVLAGVGADLVLGDTGNDSLDGGTGHDTLHGEDGDDTLTGGDGNDSLSGGAGNDQLIGGGGDDSFGLTNGLGTDAITGGEFAETNGDTLNLTALTGTVTVDLTGLDPEAGTVASAGSTATFTQIETIVLGAATETIVLADGSGADKVQGFTAPTDLGGGSFAGVDQLNVSALTDTLGNPVNVNDVAVGDDGNGNAVLTFPNGESLTLIGVAPGAVTDPAALAAMGIPSESRDFIVEGTSGDDLIDTGYIGDPEGDRIDASDNLASNNDDLVLAGAGNDTVFSTDGHDSVYGEDGNDLLQTGMGNDLIHGGGGNDAIFTENGSDTVYGGAGDDTAHASFDGDLVYGGDGNDALQGGGFASNGHDTLYGDAGNDSLYGSLGNDSLNGGADADLFVTAAFIDNDTIVGGETGTDSDTVTMAALTTGVTVAFIGNEAGSIDAGGAEQTQFSEIEHFVLTAQDDLYEASATTEGGYVQSGAGADTLQGGAGNDSLMGEAGRDSIVSGDGDDSIDAGADNDFVWAGTGNDTVSGGLGDDTLGGWTGDNILDGGAGNDTLSAEGGNDTLVGNEGQDLIFGGSGDDSIRGGDGNDIINAGDGVDTVFGDADADTFVVQNAMGTNTIFGGEAGTDSDTIDLLNHTGSAAWVVYTGNEAGTINAIGSGSTTFAEIEAMNLTQGNDFVDAAAATSGVTLHGNDGSDTITGGSGADLIYGGSGDDQLAVIDSFGTDTLVGGETGETAGDRLDAVMVTADSVLDLSAGATTEDGTLTSNGQTLTFSQIELVALGSGNDMVIGSVGNDHVITGEGNDTVNGGAGNDTFDLGPVGGDIDTVVLADGAGADTVGSFEGPINTGNGTFTGLDRLNVTGLTDALGAPVNTDDVVVSDDGFGNAVLTFPNGESVTLTGIDPTTINSREALHAMGIPHAPDLIVDGTSGSDVMGAGFVDFHGDQIDGSDGDTDTIYGYAGDDIITAGAGNDLVDAGTGGDSVFGGDGNDTVFGQTGHDILAGDAGDDILDGGSGGDTLGGGLGDDVLIGADGNDSLIGNEGNDTLAGGSGVDSIYGGANDDLVDGGTENDLISGGDGNDALFGDGGDDTVDGGAGADTIGGGDGADILTAGADNDTVFGDGGDDQLDGGDGDDSLFGGVGNDFVDAGDNADLVDGGIGDDTLDGALGNDTLTGGDGNDTLLGGDDRDFFYGGAGDVVDGGEGGDDYDTLDLTAYGHPATNVIYDAMNPENGTVEFLDAFGAVVDTISFTNIENVVACFTPGTLILTGRGEVAVEDLCEGDAVLTRDNGYQPIRWIGRRDLTGADLCAEPRFAPVQIAKGALGTNLPERNMKVSPQHRMLMTGPRAELLFGEHEVLVAATHMVGMAGITRVQPAQGVSYIHILFDQHEIVRADGTWSESFQPGMQTMSGLDSAQRGEILALFPQLAIGMTYPAARLKLKAKEAQVLLRT